MVRRGEPLIFHRFLLFIRSGHGINKYSADDAQSDGYGGGQSDVHGDRIRGLSGCCLRQHV